MSRSIKRQLLLGNIITITVVFTVICIILFFSIKSFLYSQFDRSYEDKYTLLSSLVEYADNGDIFTEWVEQGKVDPYGFNNDLEGVSLWYMDGKEISHSGLPIEFILNRKGTTTNHQSGDKMIRVKSDIVFPMKENKEMFIPDSKSRAFISYAQIDTVAPYLGRLKIILGLSWFSCVSISSLILLWNTQRSFKPFNELRSQIENIHANRLKEINLTTNTTEITPVTDSINKLLERIQTGLEREKQLTSNIAHELKNPLAGLLNLWDVTLKKDRTLEEYVRSGKQSLEATEQMVKLVRNLLGLSKLSSGETSLSIEQVNLSELLPLSWESFEKTASQRGIEVDWQLARDYYVETDNVMFNIILSNIYDNLICYADENSRAKVILTENGEIRIGNRAHNLDPETSEKIFDPLWRQSESRSEIGVHAGIGMALVQKVSTILGFKITASVSSSRDWFEINIKL